MPVPSQPIPPTDCPLSHREVNFNRSGIKNRAWDMEAKKTAEAVRRGRVEPGSCEGLGCLSLDRVLSSSSFHLHTPFL